MAKRAVPERSDGPQHRLTEKNAKSLTQFLGPERTGQDRCPVSGSLFRFFAIRGVQHHFFRTQNADQFKDQAQTDTDDRRQRHAFQLRRANMHLRAAHADNQNN